MLSFEIVKAQIDKTIIKAPFTGKLGLRMVSQGAYVTPQLVMASLQQTNQLKVDFNVPEMYSSLIQKGKFVRAIADNNQEYMATIAAEESQVNASTGNIKVRAILQQGNLKPGGFVKIQLDAGSGKQSIMVPTNAIIPDANSKKIIVVNDGKGEMVKIKIARRSRRDAQLFGRPAGGKVAAEVPGDVQLRRVGELDRLKRARQRAE